MVLSWFLLIYCVYMLNWIGGSVVLVWMVGRYIYFGALPRDDAHGSIMYTGTRKTTYKLD